MKKKNKKLEPSQIENFKKLFFTMKQLQKEILNKRNETYR